MTRGVGLWSLVRPYLPPKHFNYYVFYLSFFFSFIYWSPVSSILPRKTLHSCLWILLGILFSLDHTTKGQLLQPLLCLTYCVNKFHPSLGFLLVSYCFSFFLNFLCYIFTDYLAALYHLYTIAAMEFHMQKVYISVYLLLICLVRYDWTWLVSMLDMLLYFFFFKSSIKNGMVKKCRCFN